MNCCENCGLPEGALLSKGFTAQIVRPAENNFQRERKATVWVCSEECGVQALAISKYGSKSSTWPVPLAKLRSLLKRQLCPQPK
jgi:hypothetical protein